MTVPRDAGLEETEQLLRRALAAEAGQVQPRDRLGEILRRAGDLDHDRDRDHAHDHDRAEDHAQRQLGNDPQNLQNDPPDQVGRRRRGRSVWLAPVAAAAAALIAAGTFWSVHERGAPAPPASTGQRSSPITTSPPPSPRGKATALPVYYLGTNGGTGSRPALVREFVRSVDAAPLTDADKVARAVTLAMAGDPAQQPTTLAPWRGDRLLRAAVAADGITVLLGGPGTPTGSQATDRLAVQQLVWTAQAAVGKGAVPVKLAVADGSTSVLPGLAAGWYNRPPKAQWPSLLADIWISNPSRGATVSSSRPVVVTGDAVAPGGRLRWQLSRGAALAGRGEATTSAPGPDRGGYSIDLGRLAPGSYVMRVLTVRGPDGADVVADRRMPFTVG